MKLVINGISGKMGSFLYNYLKDKKEYDVICGISRKKLALDIPIYPDFKSCLSENKDIDTLIDFTLYPHCLDVVKQAINNKINVVSGTTGYRKYDAKQIINLAKKNNVGVIITPNFSLINKEFIDLIVQFKKYLPYIEIIEEHNIHKRDKPSGTAKYLAKVLNVSKEKVHSLRIPGIIASHKIIFSDFNQSIIFTHKINNRQAFINGIEHSLIEVTNYKTIDIIV